LNFQITYRDDDCIVDVRDVVSKEIVPEKKHRNCYVVRVEPERAVLEPDYFIKMIEQAEQCRDAEIERVEAGIVDDEVKKVDDTQNEWERLQSLPDEDYLMQTVLPVLYEGMTQLEQLRPVAPVEYLACYLLKN